MTTLDVQRQLKALGYDPGPLDGVRGRLTIRAVKAFQADRKLAVDGIAGPVTIAALSASVDGTIPPSQPSPARGRACGRGTTRRCG